MKSIISISLIFLLLISHLSIAVGTHYCAGFAVDTQLMLGHKHLDCGMAGMDEERQEKSDNKSYLDKSPCCVNKYLSISVEDEFKPSIEQTALNFDFFTVFVFSILDIVSNDQTISSYADYDPPIIIKDIPVFHLVFLL